MDRNLATQLWKSGFDGLSPWISSLNEQVGKPIVQASSLESYATMLVCYWRDNQAAKDEHWSLFFANFYREMSETLNLMEVPYSDQLSSKLVPVLRHLFQQNYENQDSPPPDFASVMIELLVGFMLLRQLLEAFALGKGDSVPFKMMSDQAGDGFVDHCCSIIPLRIPPIDGASLAEATDLFIGFLENCSTRPSSLD